MLGLHFAPGLRFTFSLQSAFYNAVCTLHLVRSQQSAVRSLRFTLTDFSLLWHFEYTNPLTGCSRHKIMFLMLVTSFFQKKAMKLTLQLVVVVLNAHTKFHDNLLKFTLQYNIMHQSIPAAPRPPGLLRGICPLCQSRGWGICQPLGHSRAFDKHAVSYRNITTQHQCWRDRSVTTKENKQL